MTIKKISKRILKEIDYALGWFLYLLWKTWKKKVYRFSAFALILLIIFQPVFPIINYSSLFNFSGRKNENTEIKEATIFSRGLYTNENKDFRIEFGDRKNKDQQKIRFEAVPVARTASENDGFISQNFRKLTSKEKKGVEFSLAGVKNSSDSSSLIQTGKIRTETSEENGKEVVLNPEAFPGIDLKYQTISGKGLKEDILIKNKENAKDTFVFDMNLDSGVKVVKTISYLKGDQQKEKRKITDYYFVNEKGEYLFNFEKPFAVDATGKRTDNVVIEITESSDNGNKISGNSEIELPDTGWSAWNEKAKNIIGNIANAALDNSEKQYQIRLSVDPKWLLDSTRIYPIIIDPSIVHDSEAEFDAGDALNRVESTSDPKVQIDNPIGGNDGTTHLLVHADGTNGSTTFTDASSRMNPITANGDAQISTAQSKFGDSSAYFDGTGDYLSVADREDFDLGASNFTIDFWAYNLTGENGVSIRLADGSYSGIVGYVYSGNLLMYLSSNGSSWDIASAVSMGAVPGENWVHYALVRNGSNFYTYRNGTQVSTFSSSASVYTPAGNLNIGKFDAYYISGYLDEIRISKGIARWTRNFTPPTRQYDYAKNYGVYTSPVIDVSGEAQTLQWSENGVQTGDGETPYSSTNLVAQWNLNETSGTSAADATGRGHTGTLSGFSSTGSQDATVNSGWTANNRRWGAGGLMFDGNDYISVPDSADWNFGTGDFAIELWVNPRVINGEYEGIIGTYSAGFIITTSYSTDGHIGVYNVTNGWIDTGVSLELNKWQHLVVTRSSGNLNVYINGALRSSTASWTGSIGNTTLLIGMWHASYAYFNGSMDAIRIYNGRGLSAEEIMSDYQSGNIEFQTRSGSDDSPDDGGWEDWTPTSAETQLASMDSDASNWSWDSTVASSTPVSKADDSTLKMEGTGSLKVQYGIPQVDANTVALWHMEETGGTGAYIKDSTANANNGTPTGTTVVDGIAGKGRSFDDSDDYIEVSDHSSLDLSTNGTIEAWIKTNANEADNWFLCKSGNYCLGVNATGALLFTGASAQDNGGTSILSGKWHHVAVTNNNSTATYYVDGEYTGVDSVGWGATLTNTLTIGKDGGSNYFDGIIDEIKISNSVLTADEIAEAYRLGRDHRLSKTISSTDLSSSSKMPFYAAGDKLGMCVEVSVGESSFANYEPDANTVALWHFEEDTGIGAYLKDSAGSNHGTPTGGMKPYSGKIGKGRKFNGSTEYVSVPDSTDFTFGTGDFTIDLWINPAVTTGEYEGIMGTYDGYSGFILTTSYTTDGHIGWWDTTGTWIDTGISLELNKWQHLAVTRSSGTLGIYVNGIKKYSTTGRTGSIDGSTLTIGKWYTYNLFNGMIDEVRIIKGEAKSADDIRQTFENGARLHPVVVDFAALLSSSNLITDSADISFIVDAKSKGLTNMGDNIFKGDKILVKENYDGTEYIAQGTVDYVVASTGEISVSSWDASSTFPSGGYTANATVFKWQREWFDVTRPMDSHVNAATKISLRSYDQIGGKNFWLDDIKYATNYLTDPTATSNVVSGDNEFFQYRAIFSTKNSSLNPYISSVTTTYENLTYPSNVSATDGTYSDKVVVSWDASPGATGYKVWDGTSWVDVGNVLTYDDINATAPVITPGTATASDGTNSLGVDLSLSGDSIADGATVTYKVRAYNTNEESPDSATDTGYRSAGSLTYQWQISAADSDANYTDIPGGTTSTYLDTLAPGDGSGRYYRCKVGSTGSTDAYSTADRGYTCALPVVTTQYPTSVAEESVNGNGNITSIGKDNVTVRGFKYGLSQADTWDVNESGTFSTGAYSLAISGLTKNLIYYVRSYATNSCGTAYGSYVSFFTIMDTAPVEFRNDVELKNNMEIR